MPKSEVKSEKRKDKEKAEETKFNKNQVKARIRCLSLLFDTTLPAHLNPFGTDGARKVPKTWPGDNLTQCRQWQGIDVGFDLKNGKMENINVLWPKFIGQSSYCGIKGQAVEALRYKSKVKKGLSANGEFVEVKAILGSRVGVYLPDIDVGLNYVAQAKGFFATLGAIISIPQRHIMEEIAEDMAEETFTGTDTNVPVIYNYIRFRVYANGDTDGGFVSRTKGGGFPTTRSIIKDQVGASLVPEHHVYIDDKYEEGLFTDSSDAYEDWLKWVDTDLPYEEYLHTAVAKALKDWCANATKAEKTALKAVFKKEEPDYYIG